MLQRSPIAATFRDGRPGRTCAVCVSRRASFHSSEFDVIARRRGVHVMDAQYHRQFLSAFPPETSGPRRYSRLRWRPATCMARDSSASRLELRFAGQADAHPGRSLRRPLRSSLVVSVNEHVHQEADLASTTGLILEELGTNQP